MGSTNNTMTTPDLPKIARECAEKDYRDVAEYVIKSGAPSTALAALERLYRGAKDAAALTTANEGQKKLIEELENGTRVILPKTNKHAEAMYLVSYGYLRDNLPDADMSKDATT